MDNARQRRWSLMEKVRPRDRRSRVRNGIVVRHEASTASRLRIAFLFLRSIEHRLSPAHARFSLVAGAAVPHDLLHRDPAWAPATSACTRSSGTSLSVVTGDCELQYSIGQCPVPQEFVWGTRDDFSNTLFVL